MSVPALVSAHLRCHQLSLSARLAPVPSKHTHSCSAALRWLDLSHCAKSATTHFLILLPVKDCALPWALCMSVCNVSVCFRLMSKTSPWATAGSGLSLPSSDFHLSFPVLALSLFLPAPTLLPHTLRWEDGEIIDWVIVLIYSTDSLHRAAAIKLYVHARLCMHHDTVLSAIVQSNFKMWNGTGSETNISFKSFTWFSSLSLSLTDKIKWYN